MAQVRGGAPSKRLVWRMTPNSPTGEYVDPAANALARLDPVDGHQSGWAVSTFDLLTGLDVIEVGDSLPADLIDELFKKPTK